MSCALVAVGVVMIAFGPAAPAAVNRSGIAIVRPVRLAELSAVSGAPGAFQATLRDAFVAAGVDVAPLGDTNKVFGSIGNEGVNRALAGGTGSRVTDPRTLRAIRVAGKQLGVAAVFLGGAESYRYDKSTGTVNVSISGALYDSVSGADLWVEYVSASAASSQGPGARRAAFDAVSLDLAQQLAAGAKGYMGGTDDGSGI